MSAFSGSKKEVKEFDFVKKVGVMEVYPVGINPDKEELSALLGRDIDREPEYLGNKDGVKTCRITVYLKEVKTEEIFNTSFFLEDRVRMNKDETKTQFINSHGQTSWAAEEDELGEWFVNNNKEVRKARVGEEELYEFLRAWLQIDFRSSDASLELDFKKLVKGNVRDIEEQIGAGYGIIEDAKKGDRPATIVVLATVQTKEVEGEMKTYQVINNKHFLQGWNIKNFQGKKFTADDAAKIVKNLKSDNREDVKKVKQYERFIANVMDQEYPVKGFFGTYLGVLRDYNEDENPAAAEGVFQPADAGEDDGSEY